MSNTNLKIAIVDDAPFVREILKATLEELGAEVVEEYPSGDFKLKNSPDIVFLDLVMPEKNGVTACKEIRDSGFLGIIIAMSTIDQKWMIEQVYEAGADEFLEKPFERQELSAILDKYRSFDLAI